MIYFLFSLQQSNILKINSCDFQLFDIDSKHSADAFNIGEQISIQRSHS